MACFRAGKLVEARAILEALLAEAPDDGRAVVLLGLIHAEESAFAAAEALFDRALALGAEPDFSLHMLGELRKRQDDHDGAALFYARAAGLRPGFAPHRNSLGVALQRTGRHEAALEAFAESLRIDPCYATALCNRGLLQQAMGRDEDAAAALSAVVAQPAGSCLSAADWHTRGLAHRHLGELPQAEAAARAGLARDPASLICHLLLAEVLERLHRPDEAAVVRAELGRLQRVVRRPCFAPEPAARVLLVAGSALCNVPTEFVLDRGRFEVTMVHLAPYADPAENGALLDSLPPFDIVFNSIGDADAGRPFLDQAGALADMVSRPVLNRPHRILPTRRDRLPGRLAGIDRLVVPPQRRLGRDEVLRGGSCLPWPMPWLIRPAGTHGGVDLRRIGSAPEMRDYLAAVPGEEYYVSVFNDFRSADGLHRKARFVFVGGEVFPYHLAICPDWLVHYWRADMTPAMRREEAAFLDDPQTVFPAAAMAAVREVARRLDLDFGGIDCASLPDGRVLLFEANATMLVQLAGSREEFGHQHVHVPRIRAALSEFILGRVRPGREPPEPHLRPAARAGAAWS